MLRANRQVLKPGGRVGFWTIHPTPGLTPAKRRYASQIGPPDAAMRSTHDSLLRSAGFGEIEVTDVSQEYASVLRAWLAGWHRREAEVRVALGDANFDRRVKNRREALQAVEDGLLMRSLCVGRRLPGRGTPA